MKNIVYANGYRLIYKHLCLPTRNIYTFRKKFVTKVKDEDYEYLLNLTSKEVPWCPYVPKRVKPFVTVEDFCNGDKQRIKDLLNNYIWNEQ